jgi:nucleotide-binding universal stress UspA family protein
VSTLLAAVDWGPVSSGVLAVANALVPLLADDVRVVSVRPASDHDVRDQAVRDQAVRDHPAALEVSVLQGEAGPSLVDASAEQGVAGIVIGLRSLSGGRRPAGHVTEHVITGSPVPVVVVPPAAVAGLEVVDRVLVPLEGQPRPGPLATGIVDRLLSAGVAVDTVHVISPATCPMFWDRWEDRDTWTRQFVSRWSPAPDGITLRVGDPAEEILAAAEADQASLVLVEWKRQLDHRTAHIVRDLLARSRRPVLLVPRTEPEEEP